MELVKNKDAELSIVGLPNMEEEIICLPSEEGQNIERVFISPKGCKIAYLLELPHELSGNTEFIVSGTNDSGKKPKRYEENINGHLKSKFYDILGDAVRKFPHIQIILPHYDINKKDENTSEYKAVYGTLNLECFKNLEEREDLFDEDKFIRIDEQIRNCISHAKSFIENLKEFFANNPEIGQIMEHIPEIENLSIREKINLWGYSQGAVFAERFSSIYPEIISKLLSGGNAGTQLIPDDDMDYPFGTRNFKELFGKEFNEEAYKNIERVQFVSEFEAVEALKSYDVNGNKVDNKGRNSKERKKEGIIYSTARDENGIYFGVDDEGNRTVLPPNCDGSYLLHECSPDMGKSLRQKRGQTLDDRFKFYKNWYLENTNFYAGVIVKNCDHGSIWGAPGLVEAFAEFYNGNGFNIDERIRASSIDMSAQEARDLVIAEQINREMQTLSNHAKQQKGEITGFEKVDDIEQVRAFSEQNELSLAQIDTWLNIRRDLPQSRLEALSNEKKELESILIERQSELETKQANISPQQRRESYEKSE